jgi:hypothetical protein
MYYCGGTIAGPFYEYKDYINFIELKEHYAKIPSTILPTLKRLMHAISKTIIFNCIVVCLIFVSTLESFLAYDYVTTDEFSELNFFYKVGTHFFSGYNCY